MTNREELVTIWPFFGLTIKTPRLQLRISDGTDLVELAVAARTIQTPDDKQKYQMEWMYEPSPKMERELFRRYWKRLATFEVDSWHIQFVVYLEGQPIGIQDIWAKEFPVTRSVTTGSWITLHHQGQGLGTEARAGVLELAFQHLGADEALTDYYGDNQRSAAVSRKLGYVDNGHILTSHGGNQGIKSFMRLAKADWMQNRTPDINVEGIEQCLELLGIDTQK